MSSSRHRRKTLRLADQFGALAIAAPLVIAQRTSQMAAHGAQPNARERAEMQRMVSEKMGAFTNAWIAMGSQALSAQQSIATAWLRACMTPWSTGGAQRLSSAMQGAALDMAAGGIAPIRRTAVANAKRLGTTRRTRR